MRLSYYLNFYFMLYKAIYRYACRLGLKTVMNEQKEVRRVIHLLNGLALLPPCEAINGLSVGDLL